jgi:diaminopimelate decarboxylase
MQNVEHNIDFHRLLNLETPIFVFDRTIFDSTTEDLSNTLKKIKGHNPLVLYSIKANNNNKVIESIIDKGFGLHITHKSETDLLEFDTERPPILVSGPTVENDFITKVQKKADFISLNTEQSIHNVLNLNCGGTRLLGRINPGTNNCSKFGLDKVALRKHIRDKSLVGLHIYLGPNFIDIKRWNILLDNLICNFPGIEYLFFGGIPSQDLLKKTGISLIDYFAFLKPHRGIMIGLDMGRYLVERAFYCVSSILDIYKNKIFLDVSTNALVPLNNQRYSIQALLRNENIFKSTQNKRYHVYDRGCMGNEFLPSTDFSVKPIPGDKLLIGNSGAYTISLWSNFGQKMPKIII